MLPRAVVDAGYGSPVPVVEQAERLICSVFRFVTEQDADFVAGQFLWCHTLHSSPPSFV